MWGGGDKRLGKIKENNYLINFFSFSELLMIWPKPAQFNFFFFFTVNLPSVRDNVGLTRPYLAYEGDDALITCVVSNVGDNTVTWKKEDRERHSRRVLTAGDNRVTGDKRFSVLHDKGQFFKSFSSPASFSSNNHYPWRDCFWSKNIFTNFIVAYNADDFVVTLSGQRRKDSMFKEKLWNDK